MGASLITGWYWSGPAGSAANLIVWNSTHTLVANTFVSEGDSILMFGGTDNVVPGDRFTQTYRGRVRQRALPYRALRGGVGRHGLQQLTTSPRPWGPTVPDFTIYTETSYSSTSASWYDLWNVSEEPSTWVNPVNGYSLSGSIVGGT